MSVSRSVNIDEDVYAHLVSNTREIGEDASSILRRLLGLPSRDTAPSGRGHGDVEQRIFGGDSPAATALLDFLATPDFGFQRNATDKYLSVLSFLYRQNPEAFAQILEVSGRRRTYFARNRGDIAKSGKSTFPQQIPDSPFWAMTNADTDQKREILGQVLTRLGYSPRTAARVGQSIK